MGGVKYTLMSLVELTLSYLLLPVILFTLVVFHDSVRVLGTCAAAAADADADATAVTAATAATATTFATFATFATFIRPARFFIIE